MENKLPEAAGVGTTLSERSSRRKEGRVLPEPREQRLGKEKGL